MSYDEIDSSRAKGRLREVYHFFRGTEDWYYTGYRTPIAFFGQIWNPLEISRGDIEVGSEDRPGAVSITVPTASDIGLLLQAGASPTPVSVKVYQYHVDAPDEFALIFNGEIQAADIVGEICEIQAVPLQGRMNRVYPRGLFQRDRCIWITYDPDTCGVSPSGFTFTGTVAAIAGLQIEVPGAAAFNIAPDFFALGIMSKGEWKVGILSQSGDVIAVDHPIPGLVVGDDVILLAGDDRKKETCHLKFDNSSERLSFPSMPDQTPFAGQGIRP